MKRTVVFLAVCIVCAACATTKTTSNAEGIRTLTEIRRWRDPSAGRLLVRFELAEPDQSDRVVCAAMKRAMDKLLRETKADAVRLDVFIFDGTMQIALAEKKRKGGWATIGITAPLFGDVRARGTYIECAKELNEWAEEGRKKTRKQYRKKVNRHKKP